MMTDYQLSTIGSCSAAQVRQYFMLSVRVIPAKEKSERSKVRSDVGKPNYRDIRAEGTLAKMW